MSTFQQGNVTPHDLECLNSRAMLQRLHRHSIDIVNIKELYETQDLPSGRTSHTRRISALEFEQRDLNTVSLSQEKAEAIHGVSTPRINVGKAQAMTLRWPK